MSNLAEGVEKVLMNGIKIRSIKWCDHEKTIWYPFNRDVAKDIAQAIADSLELDEEKIAEILFKDQYDYYLLEDDNSIYADMARQTAKAICQSKEVIRCKS